MKNEKTVKDYSETINICQSIQLAAGSVLSEVLNVPDLLEVPAYKELVERIYIAARQSAIVARMMGDDQTARFTENVCNKLVTVAKL